MCFYHLFIDWLLFHHDDWDHYWDFMSTVFILNFTLRRSETRLLYFCNHAPLCLFLPLYILFGVGCEHVTFEHLYVVFRFSTRIFYKWVPGFVTDCPCGVWCRGLTTCFLYVDPLFGNLVWNDSGFRSLTKCSTSFHCFWSWFGRYLNVSQ